MAQKHKIPELISGYAQSHPILTVLREIAPRFEGRSDEEIAETLGITHNQLERIEKKVGECYADNFSSISASVFQGGGAIEQPGVYLLYVHQSTVEKNANGSKRLKLSVKTRDLFKKELNGEPQA